MNLQLTFKQIIPYLVMAALIILASVYLHDCRGGGIKPTAVNNDSIYRIIAEKEQINDMIIENNKVLRIQIDSLKTLKPKVVVRYKTVYDSLILTDTSCINSLNMLYVQCNKVDSVNNAIITKQDSALKNYSNISGNLTDIIAMQRYKITNDSLLIKELNSNVKRKYRKGLIQGGAVGLGVGFIGALLLVK